MAETAIPAAPAAGPEVKNKRSKVLLIAIALVVCLGLGGAYVVMSHKAIAGSNQGAQPKPEALAPVAVVSLEPFTVNLADPSHGAFLRVSVSLGLGKPLVASGDSTSDLPIIPPLRDAILSVLTTWQSGDLLAAGGKAKLKAQLLSVLRQRVPKLGVTDVYFTDFLIQQ